MVKLQVRIARENEARRVKEVRAKVRTKWESPRLGMGDEEMVKMAKQLSLQRGLWVGWVMGQILRRTLSTRGCWTRRARMLSFRRR